MTEAINFVKTDLMPDFDFDAFNHENNENYEGNSSDEKSTEENKQPVAEVTTDEAPTGIAAAATPEIEAKPEEIQTPSTPPAPATSDHDEEVDKW